MPTSNPTVLGTLPKGLQTLLRKLARPLPAFIALIEGPKRYLILPEAAQRLRRGRSVDWDTNELEMKAISLTCKDEVLKDHGLLNPYRDLPKECRRRIEVDYEEIEEIMEEGRQTFGKWRYFENNIGEEGMRGIIDLERTLGMAKAARIILDEAQMVGLSEGIKRKLNEDVTLKPGTRSYEQKINLMIEGREAPPKNL